MTNTASPARLDPGRGVARRWPALAACVVVLVGLTLWFRYRAIGISSLWLDDAWVGVGAHFPTIGDTIRSGLTSPGFSLIYRGWAALFGSGATDAQLLALVFAVAAPVVLFLAAVERGLPLSAAFLGAGLLATAPAHIEMSTRLKQYTAEALVTAVVLWVAWRLLDRPASSGRWAVFTAFAVGASLLSSVGALAAGGALAVCLVATWLARPRQLRPAIVATCAYALVVVPWIVLAVRPNVYQRLTDYWRGYYLDGGGFAGGLMTRLEAVARAFQDVDSKLVLLGLVVAAGIVLVRRPLVGLLLVLPTLLAILLAALTITPIGTGRTDVYLFPSYALLVAVAVGEVAAMVSERRRWVVAVLAMAAVVVAGVVGTPLSSRAYPAEDLTPLVRIAERSRRAGDTILIYPSAGYAYGIATRYPIERRPDDRAATVWAVDVQGPDVVVLRAHREDPEKWAGRLDQLSSQSSRIWLIGSHLFPDWYSLKAMLEARGYRAVRVYNRAGAQLVLYVRGSPTAAARP